MMTPRQYVEILHDGRELYMNGRPIDDVTQSPEFKVPIAYAAADYDYDNNRTLRTCSTYNGSYGNRLFQIPRTKKKLETRTSSQSLPSPSKPTTATPNSPPASNSVSTPTKASTRKTA